MQTKSKFQKVQIKVMSNTCGKPILYPSNDLALKFLKLTRNKSLTEADLETILELGFEVEVISGS